jgi:tripartite-type tricarboxylate transporter receptor subunit TctC
MMYSSLDRRSALKLLAGGATAAAAMSNLPAASADEAFPSHAMTMVNPFAPGGYTDNLARAIAPRIGKALGQPCTVVDMPGGDGLLGYRYYLNQPQDGYMLLCAGEQPVDLNVLLHDAPFKHEDFWWINIPSRDFTLMATSAKHDTIKSLNDVVQALRKDPKSLSIGTQSASPDLINLAIFAEAIGVKFEELRIVTFEGGGVVRTNTVGGVVDVGMAGVDGYIPLRELVTPLLTFDTKQHDDFDTPTVTNANLGGSLDSFVAGTLRGFAVSRKFKDENPDRYKQLEAAYEKVFNDPETISAMKNQQLAYQWYGPEDSNQIADRTFEGLKKFTNLLKGA